MNDSSTPLLRIDDTLCRRCGDCEAVCPNRVFVRGDAEVVLRRAGRCIECGHCVAVCPTEAFHHAKLPDARFAEVPEIYPLAPDALLSLFSRRRSCRRYTDEKVSTETLNALLDAAAAAPTATNSRNVRFLVLDTPEEISALAEHTARYYLKLERQLNNPVVRFLISLAVGRRTVDAYKFHLPNIAEWARDCLAGKQHVFSGAPLVLAAYASGLPHIAAANGNLAVMQMMHQAEALGLGTCYNGYALTALMRERPLRRLLRIPAGSTPVAVLAVGHPAVRFHRAPKRRRPRAVSADSGFSKRNDA